jgi:Tfp pilus assembly PilM family ATPase
MMSKGEKTPHVVIAAAKDDGRFKAVEVRKHEDALEVLWTKSLPAGEQTWTAFAAACGVAAAPGGHERAQKRHAPAVVGLDSTGVAFYRVTAPAVESQEMASIVRMQAESLLPLPPDQIEVAWRTTPSANGNVDITIAAARREYLHKFAGSVHDFRPARILLSCEGTVRAWQSLFADGQPPATGNGSARAGQSRTLLMSIGAENTQLCLVQNGAVTQAAVLGTGTADLEEGTVGSKPEPATLDPASATNPPSAIRHPQFMERFAHDVRTVLGSFGWDESVNWPILVLSDGGAALSRIVAALNEAGLPAKISLPEARGLKLPAGFTAQDIYEYRTPLGLSLLALEKPAGALDLFERIIAEQEQEKTTTAWRSVLVAGAVAAAMFIALFATTYLADAANAKRWGELVARPDFEAARQHQALLKTVARHRPDMLELLAALNTGKNDGIVLDSLHFKKGQPVTIAGQAGTTEQMWAFEKNLRTQKDVANVAIVNPTQDSKTKKIKFTITFSYKGFSKKDAVV